MKFLIFFAVAAFFGSVQCDTECFRAVLKECFKETVPWRPLTLCGDVKPNMECMERFARTCNMDFRHSLFVLNPAIQRVCEDGILKERFDNDKECYKRAVNATECMQPIYDVFHDIQSNGDGIRANKKTCGLFKPYSKCVRDNVEESCGFVPRIFFNFIFDPLYDFANSLCDQLILSADEQDTQEDNFGNLNPVEAVTYVFLYA